MTLLIHRSQDWEVRFGEHKNEHPKKESAKRIPLISKWIFDNPPLSPGKIYDMSDKKFTEKVFYFEKAMRQCKKVIATVKFGKSISKISIIEMNKLNDLTVRAIKENTVVKCKYPGNSLTPLKRKHNLSRETRDAMGQLAKMIDLAAFLYYLITKHYVSRGQIRVDNSRSHKENPLIVIASKKALEAERKAIQLIRQAINAKKQINTSTSPNKS